MKVIYENFGCLRLEAEDGRDNAWLSEMADKFNDHTESEVLDNFIVFQTEETETGECTIKEATEVCVLKGVEINPFGHYASPYEFEKLHNAYWKQKEEIKIWLTRHHSKGTRQDGVQIWNKLFPDEKIICATES